MWVGNGVMVSARQSFLFKKLRLVEVPFPSNNPLNKASSGRGDHSERGEGVSDKDFSLNVNKYEQWRSGTTQLLKSLNYTN